MGGTPSFELTFFGVERSVPDCLIRLIRDLEQGIISEAEFEPYEVRGAVCYAVEPSEPEGTFAEIREIEEWTDTDPVVKRRRREGDCLLYTSSISGLPRPTPPSSWQTQRCRRRPAWAICW